MTVAKANELCAFGAVPRARGGTNQPHTLAWTPRPGLLPQPLERVPQPERPTLAPPSAAADEGGFDGAPLPGAAFSSLPDAV